MDSNYLEHYGRKGMKWGQHIFGEFQSQAKYAKGKSTNGTLQKNKKETTAKPETKVDKPKAPQQKRLQDLTNEELDALLKRARMEDEYRRLQPQKIDIGKRLVKNVLLPVLEQQAKNYLNAQLGKVVSNLTKDPPNPPKKNENSDKEKK